MGLVGGMGLSFGLIGVVLAIAYESSVALPDGVAPKEYVTLGRREAGSGVFSTVSTLDFAQIASKWPEVEWSYGSYYAVEGRAAEATGVAQRREGRRVSANHLSLLGVGAALGSIASSGDADAVVISARMWTGAFGDDPDVIGQAVVVDDLSVPIVGVADQAFDGLFGSPPDFWILDADSAHARQGATTVVGGLYMFGVLRAGANAAALQGLLVGHRFPLAEQRDDHVEMVPGLDLYPDARRDVRQRLAWLAMGRRAVAGTGVRGASWTFWPRTTPRGRADWPFGWRSAPRRGTCSLKAQRDTAGTDCGSADWP